MSSESAVTPGLLVLLAYPVVLAVVAVLGYLVLRFAIRDGMKGHTLWLERRRPRD